MTGKSEGAFRTIGEVAENLDIPQHVLRFWETRFKEIEPVKRAGGRRYYRPRDVEVVAAIRDLLYRDGYTIKGVQRIFREKGTRAVIESVRRTRLASGDEAASPSLPLFPDIENAESVAPDAATGSRAEPSPTAQAQKSRSSAGASPAGLSRENASRLRAALAELGECKRLLAADWR